MSLLALLKQPPAKRMNVLPQPAASFPAIYWMDLSVSAAINGKHLTGQSSPAGRTDLFQLPPLLLTQTRQLPNESSTGLRPKGTPMETTLTEDPAIRDKDNPVILKIKKIQLSHSILYGHVIIITKKPAIRQIILSSPEILTSYIIVMLFLITLICGNLTSGCAETSMISVTTMPFSPKAKTGISLPKYLVCESGN